MFQLKKLHLSISINASGLRYVVQKAFWQNHFGWGTKTVQFCLSAGETKLIWVTAPQESDRHRIQMTCEQFATLDTPLKGNNPCQVSCQVDNQIPGNVSYKGSETDQSLNVENKPKECKAKFNHGSKEICVKCTFRAMYNMGVDKYTCSTFIIIATIQNNDRHWSVYLYPPEYPHSTACLRNMPKA